MGLGLCLLGGAPLVGCGVGTDPSLLAVDDGAPPPTDASFGDAEDNSPPSIPPIDQRTYEDTETATFALG